jgi:DNA-binding transcriptional LysR family regulator
VPYFGSALECVAGTDLVLTATSSAARLAARRDDLRVVEAPPEITGFAFQAVWHPRVSSDPAHRWLRERLVGLMTEAEPI